ncbi:2'-5' RNA ligase family protein [Austwickia chelonae]|uniref:2'-5' RNA ligase family protein n=1 Tax=Austwickia chelonae TaxID=100225 RepID=UPI000E251F89|nr:2'-5' RNA ligase family protein [Austwickia chelonae]
MDLVTRVGVAIALPEPHAGLLQEARRNFGDLQGDLVRTHVTLAGPREIPDREMSRVQEHLAMICRDQGPFDVLLQGATSFRPVTQVSYLRVCRGAEECRQLAEAICTGPLAAPQHYPYHPHVTLAQDLPEEALDRAEQEFSDYSLGFRVQELGLYACDRYDRWRLLRDFALERLSS